MKALQSCTLDTVLLVAEISILHIPYLILLEGFNPSIFISRFMLHYTGFTYVKGLKFVVNNVKGKYALCQFKEQSLKLY